MPKIIRTWLHLAKSKTDYKLKGLGGFCSDLVSKVVPKGSDLSIWAFGAAS